MRTVAIAGALVGVLAALANGESPVTSTAVDYDSKELAQGTYRCHLIGSWTLSMNAEGSGVC
jgi:6-phosphogluconate dehydrogenase (decarboxylating)